MDACTPNLFGKEVAGKKVAVVGAGICGSLAAWGAVLAGCEVHVFEPDEAQKSCSFTAAGMLAPMAELESSDDRIYRLGLRSVALWPQIIETLELPVFYRDNGTLVVSHRQDEGAFNQFVNVLKHKLSDDFSKSCELLSQQTLEPELKNLGTSLYLKKEAQVDSLQALQALHSSLKRKAHWHATSAHDISAYNVNGEDFEWVFDCRGLSAQKDIHGLHGVRGEVITVDAPQVNITRMVRVMHPRYKIYIVPREHNRYMIGATEIQSDDTGPMSVRSTLELLSAAFSVHSGFAEARILALDTNVRPTTMDHQPVIDHTAGLTRINGLYRHGYLLAPALVEKAFKGLGLELNPFLKKDEHADCI
jgi:glycine oxidase